MTAPVRSASTLDSRGFALVAALVLGFGGLVVPAAGWVVGAALVCVSPLWRRWEKVTAIAAPVAVLVLASAIVWVSDVIGSAGRSDEGAHNPLVPAVYDLFWWNVMAVALVVVPASGLWLLWRLRHHTAR
ncbi:hypothetical protein [Microbacterium sp.]|uniref:hypothetical protein n=1 Tax=Microbacterium sp. TaxID=51671 RepID=UPI002810B67A|nr:hypothetical protein [Microbacterium sp.]